MPEQTSSTAHHEKLADKGVQALQKALEAKNVKIDPQALKDAVKEAHTAAIENCEQCANGWHW